MLFAPRRKRRPGCLVVLLLALVLLGLTLGLNHLNNGFVDLLRETASITRLDKALEGFAILHLSDLHAASLGEKQAEIRKLLRTESYRAVCLTGDMVGLSGNAQPFLDLLDVFPEDVPVYFIAGDNDPAPLNLSAGSQVKADFIRQAEAKGAIYLDSPQQIIIGKRSIWFAPASLYTTDLDAATFALDQRRQELQALADRQTPDDQAALRAVIYQQEVLALSRQAAQSMRPEDAFVLLSHHPLDALQIDELHQGEGRERQARNFPGAVSLILAGHWNNGQWRLPFIGPVWVPSGMMGLEGWLPGSRAVSGMAVVHGVPEYVSPGLGTSGAYPWQPFRLFNRPQMTLIKLSASR